MSVIYLTYANLKDDPLPSLREEEDRVNELLTDRKRDGHFILERDSYTTIPKIRHHLLKYQEDLVFFGFSGHAGRDRLITEEEPARAEGIAHLLGLCPNLKVVFLNGCSTAGQIIALQEAGVPAVIATHAPVEDDLAKEFAIALFEALNEPDKTLKAAFDYAEGAIKMKEGGASIRIVRGVRFEEPEDDLWAFVCQDEAVLEWRLPNDRSNLPIRTLLKDHLEVPDLAKVFFIVDPSVREKYFLKIENSFRKEIREGKVLFNDLFGISREVNRDGITSELEASDLVIFLINGLGIYNIWNQISWVKDILQERKTPLVFVKLPGASKPLDELSEEVGVPDKVLPEYREMFDHLDDRPAALEGYLINSFKGELWRAIESVIGEERSIPEQKLQNELIDFDLTEPTNAFKVFLEEGWQYNLALLQGTHRCGQDLLLFRLQSYLSQVGRNPIYLLPFQSNEGAIREEEDLWEKFAIELIKTPVKQPSAVAAILDGMLKNQDVILVIENVVTREMTQEQATKNLDLLAGFWKNLSAQLSQSEIEGGRLFIFAVIRAGGQNFQIPAMDSINSLAKSIVLPAVSRINQNHVKDWYLEKRRKFAEPEFQRLEGLIEEMDRDERFLSDVLLRICQVLDCEAVYAKMIYQ